MWMDWNFINYCLTICCHWSVNFFPSQEVGLYMNALCHISASKKLNEHPKKTKGRKSSKTAAKVALMKMKMNAAGDKKIPEPDRVYFSVVLPGGSISKGPAKPLFFSKVRREEITGALSTGSLDQWYERINMSSFEWKLSMYSFFKNVVISTTGKCSMKLFSHYVNNIVICAWPWDQT